MLARFAKIGRVVGILCALELLVGFAVAQTTNSLVDTWNFRVTVTGGCAANCTYTGMLGFNQGGTVVEQRATTVEYSGLGYVDRTALGTWRSTAGNPAYTFIVKNFVFDATGKLSGFILGTSGITLSSSLKSFSGSGTANIYKGGHLIDTETLTITGTRF